MGTPEFAASFLEKIYQTHHTVSLVVTQPDRPKGRGQKLAAPAVKEKAIALGLKVEQPVSLKAAEFHEVIRAEAADLLVVVAYRILPDTLFPLTRLGAVNVHGSLLPKYRGAAPIQWAVAKGESETGVTLFQLDALIDHGKILAQAKTKIGIDETAGDIFEKLRVLGQDLLLKVLDDLESGTTQGVEQNHDGATPAPKLKKENGKLDFNLSAHTLHNHIRAFNPYPICYALQKGTGKVLRIHRSQVMEENSLEDKALSSESTALPYLPTLAPGEVQFSPDRYPLVGTGSGVLKLLEVQWEAKPKLSGPDFMNGLQDRENLFLE